MKGMRFYKKAIDALCIPNSDTEIGSKIGEDGLRHSAIVLTSNGETLNGKEIYTLIVDRELLNELAEEENE